MFSCFYFLACARKSQRTHPSFTADLRLVAIFLTEIFELATTQLKQSENFLKIASRSGGSDGALMVHY
ncbi:hypothetical protein FXB78_03910 [Aggregatibacter actinomycetemcomitans]|nr:hypothetical protein FXB81_04455 [Aggregatibacter actinomycetemcomitans]TYB29540.1 hypothetical protein FXB78_03910 [Aggregatibacter actinomycetemcomitans]